MLGAVQRPSGAPTPRNGAVAQAGCPEGAQAAEWARLVGNGGCCCIAEYVVHRLKWACPDYVDLTPVCVKTGRMPVATRIGGECSSLLNHTK